jgi:hypothetical protein
VKKLVTRRTTGIGVILLLMSLVIAVGLPVAATNDNCTGQKGGWDVGVTSGPWGTITDNGNGSVSVTLNPGYSLELCVKGGDGFAAYNVTGSGGPFWPPADCGNARNPQQCGLSHWGIRNVVLTTTTTTQPPTTTTTQPPTTTTTQPPTTTTTQPPTTTTQPPTTTTQPPTTTTQPPTTTTGPPTISDTDVLGIQVSAPENAQVNQVTQETLPFTGISTGSMALLAAAMAGAGLLLLLAARQNDEKSPARSWN